MISNSAANDFRNLEEEDEEEEEDAGIDDALLGELDDDTLVDEEIIDPLLKAEIDPLAIEEEEKEEDAKIFDDGEDDEEEDMDYDSFDDHDEL